MKDKEVTQNIIKNWEKLSKLLDGIIKQQEVTLKSLKVIRRLTNEKDIKKE